MLATHTTDSVPRPPVVSLRRPSGDLVRSTSLSYDAVANVSQIVVLDKSFLTERLGKLSAAKAELLLAGIDVILVTVPHCAVRMRIVDLTRPLRIVDCCRTP